MAVFVVVVGDFVVTVTKRTMYAYLPSPHYCPSVCLYLRPSIRLSVHLFLSYAVIFADCAVIFLTLVLFVRLFVRLFL